jgi:hypothetical protein
MVQITTNKRATDITSDRDDEKSEPGLGPGSLTEFEFLYAMYPEVE